VRILLTQTKIVSATKQTRHPVSEYAP